jgi:hypothetical protein
MHVILLFAFVIQVILGETASLNRVTTFGTTLIENFSKVNYCRAAAVSGSRTKSL